MTDAQLNKYRAEWGKARRWFRAHGFDPKQADAKRHELHQKAFGYDKSSKDLSNPEFDKILGVFSAVHDGGNLDAQIRQIDQPLERKWAMEKRIFMAGAKFITGNDRSHVEAKTIRYCSGIWKRLFGKTGAAWQWPIPDEKQLAKVMGVIEAQARRKTAAKNGQVLASTAAASEDDGDPF